MSKNMMWRGPGWLTMLGFVAGSLCTLPALAQTPLQSQDSNIAGIVAEIVECKRQDGVLSLRMRLRNTSDREVRVDFLRGDNYDTFYLTAASKKYFILRDSEKRPLAPQNAGGDVSVSIAKGASYVWWSKYPAPPADVKKVGYYTPITPPFDNVPITD